MWKCSTLGEKTGEQAKLLTQRSANLLLSLRQYSLKKMHAYWNSTLLSCWGMLCLFLAVFSAVKPCLVSGINFKYILLHSTQLLHCCPKELIYCSLISWWSWWFTPLVMIMCEFFRTSNPFSLSSLIHFFFYIKIILRTVWVWPHIVQNPEHCNLAKRLRWSQSLLVSTKEQGLGFWISKRNMCFSILFFFPLKFHKVEKKELQKWDFIRV